MRESPLVLAIETSCDDTACAVMDGAGVVLASVVSSQMAAHRPYGGVVPEIASREHLTNWPDVCEQALSQSGISLQEIDLAAATRGPGLIGALLVGLSLGRAIAYGLGLPFHAVHHLEGHLYSPFLRELGEPAAEVPEEFVGLVVSGGHTTLFAVDNFATRTLAETRDDAMGEVFDKVGKRLGLDYPQGPRVDALAEHGDAASHPLPIATCSDGSLDFSYSGLKSQTLLAIRRLEEDGIDCRLSEEPEGAPSPVLDLLAGFRAAAVGQLVDRLERLHTDEPFQQLGVSGGVAANRLLRPILEQWAEGRGVRLRLVPPIYSGDNAAMIAFAALLRERRGLRDDPLDVDAASRIPL